MSLRNLLALISASLFAFAGLFVAFPNNCAAFATQTSADSPPDHVFTNSFEMRLAGFDDILLSIIATADATCPQTGYSDISVRPGAPVRLCYRLENKTDVTLDQHEIVSSTYGLLYQGSQPLAPHTSIVIADPGSPRYFQHRAMDLVSWRTSGAGRQGQENRSSTINIAPDIALYRFLTTDAANCVSGIEPYSATLANSGYTALTVAPGDSITHCFRAVNASHGNSINTLIHSSLNDSGFGPLLDTSQSFSTGQVFTVAAQAPATTSMEFDAQWTATDGVDTVSADAHSTLHVTTNPACDGIRESTSYDYIYYLFGSYYLLANTRLDFEVEATPVTPGAAATLNAHGAITSLFPANSFGPRRDTRIYLPIPAGIDLARTVQAQASINGGIPISASLDVPGRMLVLSTGRVEGAPAEVDVQVSAFVEASQTTPIVWAPPALQLDVEGDNGLYTTTDIKPDPTGPPVLVTPLCALP